MKTLYNDRIDGLTAGSHPVSASIFMKQRSPQSIHETLLGPAFEDASYSDVSRRPDNMKRPSSAAKEVNWFRSMAMDEKRNMFVDGRISSG
ncbi:hypothetical protein M422DRAFT_256316 [Sphaerobolus stellatus SS14]|uniref:Uncharacterized protein n=1 Tax=Sphaerobolus stellatus (strain SS14) TaxID=990650 RepID=A0A0C9VQS8_SPHS4|nr:hypothetical protein M422DRAFT_256316 [Sphaerobolus stellatus SS14]